MHHQDSWPLGARCCDAEAKRGAALPRSPTSLARI